MHVSAHHAGQLLEFYLIQSIEKVQLVYAIQIRYCTMYMMLVSLNSLESSHMAMLKSSTN